MCTLYTTLPHPNIIAVIVFYCFRNPQLVFNVVAALAVAAAAVYEQVQDDKFMLMMGEAGSGKTFLARPLWESNESNKASGGNGGSCE